MPALLSTFALSLLPALAFTLPQASRPTWDGPFRNVPIHAKADNTYFTPPGPVTSRYYLHESNQSRASITAVYQARPHDIPFTALVRGKLNFFKNHFNSNPSAALTNVWAPNNNDRASNSACGIPDNAYNGSKVAIHPYWLKYVPKGIFDSPLERMCGQDVCISVWNETGFKEGKTDVMVKVTDICSTDPKDPSYCADPSEIMIDRIKGYQLYHWTNKTKGGPEDKALRTGAQYPHPVWWFFSKCFQDGLVHKGYNHTDNWFANPPLPNNWNNFSIPASVDQHKNNQNAYKKAKLPLYEMGGWLTTEEKRIKARFDVLADWKKDGEKSEVKWCPVAGGEAKFGKPPAGSGCVEQVASS